MSTTRPVRQSGFSLIELLVVVAIIGILAALSLPQVQTMIKKGKESQSMGNLRQIGVALSAYAGENDGYYPPLASSPSFGQNYWSQSVSPYLGAPNKNASIYIRVPDGYVSQVLLSPLVPKGQHHFWGDYGANQEVIRYPSNPTTASQSTPMSLASVSDASRLVAVMEARFLRNGVYPGSWYINTSSYVARGSEPTGEPCERGTGRIPSLFCDGHVEAIKKQDFVDNRRRYLLCVP